MPNRIIRDSILDSERYLSIGESERLFFLHLCLLADDLGCLSLAPAYLGRRVFSERPGPARIEKLLKALEGVDLLRRYEFNGSPYGFIPRFRQRVQRETLKHPAPPDEILRDQKDAVEMFKRIKAKHGNQPVGKPIANGGEQSANRSPTAEVEVKGREEKRSEGARARDPETPTTSHEPSPPPVEKESKVNGKTLHERAQALGIKQRDGEPKNLFMLRVASEEAKAAAS